jgi:hypothetical protein
MIIFRFFVIINARLCERDCIHDENAAREMFGITYQVPLPILFFAVLLQRNVLSDRSPKHDSKGERGYYGREIVIR